MSNRWSVWMQLSQRSLDDSAEPLKRISSSSKTMAAVAAAAADLHLHLHLHLLQLHLMILLLLFVFSSSSSSSVLCRGFAEEEEFSEELLLKPLPDRKVLAHFNFHTRAPPTATYGRHHRLFPKPIYHLVQKFHVRQMELSFTQGRWNYESWGGSDPISSSNAKPPGLELWAVFDVPPDQVDASWKNLTHALSGLFCASINFLQSSTAYSAPDWGSRSLSGSLRYGTLPREAVCTENLTPWLKLLPCRDKVGISALMDRPSIYRGFYHSQRLHLTSTEFTSDGDSSGLVLEQTLSVVLQPSTPVNSMTHFSDHSMQPSWSLSSIFGRKISGRCLLAKHSNAYLLLERDLVLKLKKLQKENQLPGGDELTSEDSWINLGLELSVLPDRVIKEVNGLDSKISSILYEFSVDKYNSFEPFDLGIKWKHPVLWSCFRAPLHATRFLMGSGNERGAIAISLRSNELSEGPQGINVSDSRCNLRVDVFQVVPWYVKVYFHTLQVFLDGQPQSAIDAIEKIRVSPSKDKLLPGVMEIVLKFACSVKSVAITVEFDKGFLHIDEYPPDANQGFDIPSAIINFADFSTSMRLSEENLRIQSPLLSRLKDISPVLSYTEVLLVPLTTPDFSMPYNVITITCTVFALYFGSLLNVLRRRVGEEKRILEDRAGKRKGKLPLLLSKISAKLRGGPREMPVQSQSPLSSLLSSKLILRVILVAAIAISLHYYLE